MNHPTVKIWEEDVIIPTYKTGLPDKNPMFFEKRVYQGSSGKVYPYPIVDKIYDEIYDEKYHVVYLENEYLKIMVMPSLGGRIQSALDKTNNYDFIYHNKVIKPALVGLLGPWISGGIEFNWPQHHRPGTFQAIDYRLSENEDGSCTVWLGEIELMSGLKEAHGITLYPGKSYIEINVKVFNRRPYPATFLWWANPAVSVNDSYQSVFPPDVNSIADHGRRDISRFPIATGEYYKVDYSAGVDISWYKNIPVPSSMMATKSKYDFIGGYDNNKQAGILHVANHHISPGKKMWTWGTGDFGKAWEKHLTDNDGPYIELMTGVYTDNQPDFTWLQPYEMKMFTQYFLPYKKIGVVKNASHQAAVSLSQKEGHISFAVYATSLYADAVIRVSTANNELFKTIADISPEKIFSENINMPEGIKFTDIIIDVEENNGRVLISYQPECENEIQIPEPAKPAGDPKDIKTNEELFLTGLHIEQYRHATFDPDPYYLEALARDEFDVRCNNAYGLLLLKKSLYKESERYFNNAVKRLTERNQNPYDCEPYYNLGLCLKYQHKYDEAYDAFYKATWSGVWHTGGYFSLAQISSIKKNYGESLEHINRSLSANSMNLSGRNLKTSLLRKLNYTADAICFAMETLSVDILNYGARYELYKLYSNEGRIKEADTWLSEMKAVMHGNMNNYIELSLEYSNAGMYEEASEILGEFAAESNGKIILPMVYYHLAGFARMSGRHKEAKQYADVAASASTACCFPSKLESVYALQSAIEADPGDANAYYLLGNFYYDKRLYNNAIECWEKSIGLNMLNPTAFRNLSIAYFNKKQQPGKAEIFIKKAFDLDSTDSRLLYELDLLYKKTSVDPELRLENLLKNITLVNYRDDLFLEMITLHNRLGHYEKAIDLLISHKFHPWEGGEGKVIVQYILAHTEAAKELISKNIYNEALEHLLGCKTYPDNLGEGKLVNAREENVNYLLGCVYEKLNMKEKAAEYFNLAVSNEYEPSLSLYYNDQPSDIIYYQGLAFLKLNNPVKAESRFNKLVDYGERGLFTETAIDYFAVSLPNFYVYEDSLQKTSEVNCRYLMALGYLGLNLKVKAEDQLNKVLQLDISHQGAAIHLKNLAEGRLPK